MKKLFVLSMVMLMLCSCSDANETDRSIAEDVISVISLKDEAVGVISAAEQTVICEESLIETADSVCEKTEVLLDVPFYDQSEYPTGCELVSASMLLEYHGFHITPAELIDKGHIKTSTIHFVGDTKYGCDPNKAFIGSPYDTNGYGCYAGAIKNCLESYLPNEYIISDLSGMSLKDICREYINADIPVLIWASIDMRETFKNEINSWMIEDTGERFQWISGEHCLVLVGYDDSFYYFNDPLNDKDTAYERALVEKRYEELGKQALAVINNK